MKRAFYLCGNKTNIMKQVTAIITFTETRILYFEIDFYENCKNAQILTFGKMIELMENASEVKTELKPNVDGSKYIQYTLIK